MVPKRRAHCLTTVARATAFFLGWQTELKLGEGSADPRSIATHGGTSYGTYHAPARPHRHANLAAVPAPLSYLRGDDVGGVSQLSDHHHARHGPPVDAPNPSV